MRQIRKRKEILNGIGVFVLTLALSLALPLQAKEEKSAQNHEKVKDRNKSDITEFVLANRKNKSFSNSELFSLTEKEYNISRLKLILEQKKSDSLSKSSKHKPMNIKYKKMNIPSNSIEQYLYTSSLVTFVALNIGDYFTTREALKYRGLKESNPFMKAIVKNTLIYTTVKLGLSAFIYHKMQKLHKKSKILAWIMSAALNSAYSYVIVRNIRLINKVKAK